MIVDLPAGLMAENWDELGLLGEFWLVERDVDYFVYGWRLDGDQTALRVDWVAGTAEIPDDASQAQIDMLAAAVAGYGQPPAWDAAYQQIRSLAQSAVGEDIRDLTAGQIQALLAVLLWDARAIGDDLTVRPLGEWVVRRPAG